MADKKSNFLKPIFGNIPDELKATPHWLMYKGELKEGEEKLSKVPYVAGGPMNRKGLGSSTNPKKWRSFDEAKKAFMSGQYDGIGFATTTTGKAIDPFTFIDFDHVVNPETKEITSEFARVIIERLDTYCEYSPSGDGIHVILVGSIPKNALIRHDLDIELYASGRYLTITGHHVPGTPKTIESRYKELREIYIILNEEKDPDKVREHFGLNGGDLSGDEPERNDNPKVVPIDLFSGGPSGSTLRQDIPPPLHGVFAAEAQALLIESGDDLKWIDHIIKNFRDGPKMGRLMAGDLSGHPSQSEADLSLCCKLVWYLSRDPVRVDAVFRESGLMRPKWDKVHHSNGDTYGQGTIKEALKRTTGQYVRRRKRIGYMNSDLGNAERFVDKFGHMVRFCWNMSEKKDERKGWFVWDGWRWKPDDRGKIHHMGKKVVRGIHHEVAKIKDADLREKTSKWAFQSEALTKRNSMLFSARSEPGVPVIPDELDRNPMLLNVMNGTLDLETCKIREHRQEDLITKLCPVPYEPDAKATLWEQFLEFVLEGNQDLIDFVQRALGYSLTGLTKEQVLFFLLGPGANGKSTFLRPIAHILSGYFKQTAFDTFISQRNDNRIRADLARLRGARFISASEVEDGKRFDEAVIKAVTGEDRISVRFLHQNPFEFTPEGKIWLSANSKPVIRGTDHAIWRRFRLIPFNVIIPEEEQDRDLSKKLIEEAPGILAWMVEGFKQWQEHGLGNAKKVDEATDKYRAEMDLIAEFIDDACVVNDSAMVKCGELHKAYEKWCDKRGEKSLKQRSFGPLMERKGYVKEQKKGGYFFWMKIGLKTVQKPS